MDQPLRARTRATRTAPDRLGWGIGVSIALHAAALVGLAFIPHHVTPAPDAPAIELVMLPVEVEPAPASESATPEKETSSDQPPGPEPASTPEVTPPPPEPTPPPVPQVTPPPAEPAPPVPPPAPLPEPPPAPPPPPPRARPVARRPPIPRRPSQPATEPPADASVVTQASPGPPEPPAAPARLDSAWLAGVSQWLLTHRTYPEMARELGRQGTVMVQITVDPDGHVQDVKLIRGSGSESLDRAAQALVRNAQLPPFPPDMNLPRQTLTLPIRYRLE